MEGVGAFRRDGGERGMGRVGVDLVGLAGGAASNEFSDKGGHPRPPVIFLEKGDSAEVSAMGPGKGFMDVFDQGVTGGFRDIEMQFVV